MFVSAEVLEGVISILRLFFLLDKRCWFLILHRSRTYHDDIKD